MTDEQKRVISRAVEELNLVSYSLRSIYNDNHMIQKHIRNIMATLTVDFYRAEEPKNECHRVQ